MPPDTRSSGGATALAQHIQTTSVALGGDGGPFSTDPQWVSVRGANESVGVNKVANPDEAMADAVTAAMIEFGRPAVCTVRYYLLSRGECRSAAIPAG